jgi:REP element-mobilizing transposase RayT
MSRPIRIEFPDALYHVTARGDRREDIFEDDADRQMFLTILEQVITQFNWLCQAWCLMDNHCHLMIQTPDGNLSKGMRQLNGVYTQTSNRRHKRVGHLFQGRFKAILVDSDAYLLELARYVVLNPVRAGMVDKPGDWSWSSYRSCVGLEPVAPWLEVESLLAQFGKRRSLAHQRYAQFVSEGINGNSPWSNLKGQVYLGDDQFVERTQAHIQSGNDIVQIPLTQRRRTPPSLAEIESQSYDRKAAMIAAHATGDYSYQQIADYFGLYFTTVGKIVRDGRG